MRVALDAILDGGYTVVKWSNHQTTNCAGASQPPAAIRRPIAAPPAFATHVQHRMKITDCRVIVCSPGRNFVTLKIVTDEGVHGVGDATLNGRELAVASYLGDHVIPTLIGRDPAQIEDIWQYLYRGAYWRRGPVTMSAIAPIPS